MSLELEEYLLGESHDPISLESSADFAEATLDMAQKAYRSLNIFTHTLDSRIYNSKAMYVALLKHATYSRHSKVRIIIKDSMNVVKRGSRLVELSYRISSRVQIRKPPIEYQQHTEEFMIADDIGIIYRPVATRYQGELNYYAPMQARQRLKFFNECWEHSAQDPELRRLHL